MDENRKRILAIVAAIFLCRKLPAEPKPSPARDAAFYEAIQLAEELMRRIDARWPRDRIPGKT
jgi:hypothetical protein